MLDKYAEELREAREKKGITLQQMAAKTRIDIKFLEAIDNGNFSFLPELTGSKAEGPESSPGGGLG